MLADEHLKEHDAYMYEHMNHEDDICSPAKPAEAGIRLAGLALFLLRLRYWLLV